MLHVHKTGYSLVEVLVAISILLLAIIGPMTIAAKGLQGAYYAREQTTALFLAQEGIELVIAMRNDSYIEAIQAGDLTGAWDWQSSARISSCFAAAGCNLVLESNAVSQMLDTGMVWVEPCSPISNCLLQFNSASNRARYNSTSGNDTKYTRVIHLTGDAGGDGVLISSTVTWEATIFAGAEQSVTLDSAVYRIY